MKKKRLLDIFAGHIELTAHERGHILHVLTEAYMRGWSVPKEENHRDFSKQVMAKISALKLHRMVTPDGKRLVSVEEHDAIVAQMYPDTDDLPDFHD